MLVLASMAGRRLLQCRGLAARPGQLGLATLPRIAKYCRIYHSLLQDCTAECTPPGSRTRW